jgi:WD40 repeat protein/transcriptional regulator with XRE-family HTH domain
VVSSTDGHDSEPFQSLLLRYRGRTGLTQREVAARAGVHVRSVQDWESGTNYPGAPRLQALIGVYMEAGGFTVGREAAEAEALWAAASLESPRLHAPFDREWFEAAQQAKSETAVVADAPLVLSTSGHPGTWRREERGEAPDILGFQGRVVELTALQNWVGREHCRLVAVLGIGGVGKSVLAARLAHMLAPEFEQVYWRSLRNTPPPYEWLGDTLGFLSPKHALPSSEAARIALLAQLLRSRRSLLVLDNLEAVLRPGEYAGNYRDGYEIYGDVLDTIAHSAHESCVVLTSREMPPELWQLVETRGPVRALELGGLSAADSRALLDGKGLRGDEDAWRTLVEWYGGNALALKVVGETIRQVFGGDLAAFLAYAASRKSMIVGGVRHLLDEQVVRLSENELAVLRWLAIEREPVSPAQLADDLGPAVTRGALIESLEGLRRRSLVERSVSLSAFTLQSVVLEYETDRLVADVCTEIISGQARLLIDYPLIKAQAKDYVRRSQERLIGHAVLDRLAAAIGHPAAERQLQELLDHWRASMLVEHGFGPGNVVNLLRVRHGNLRGVDMSHLQLRQVYLLGVGAQDANLASSQLVHAALAETFTDPASVALSSNGAYLVAGTTTGEVRLWRVGDRTPLWSVQAHQGTIKALAASGDGRIVASGSHDGSAALWDATNGSRLAILGSDAGAVWDLALAADAGVVATANQDGTARTWDVLSGAPLATLAGRSGALWSIAISVDGRFLATGSVDGTVSLWDASERRLLWAAHGHADVVWGVALCRRGDLLVSQSLDGTVKVWHTSGGGRLLATLPGSHGIWGVALSSDGRLLASVAEDGSIKLWEISTGHLLATIAGQPGAIWYVAMSADGRLLAGAQQGTIRLWENGSSGGYVLRPIATLEGNTDSVFAVTMSDDARLVATASQDRAIRVWDTHTGELLATMLSRASGVRSVTLSADGRLVASGGEDGTVTLWDVATCELLGTLRGHSSIVWSVAMSEDTRLVASGSQDGTARVWEATGGRTLAILEGHTGGVWGVALSRDAQLLATSSQDETVRLWEATSGRLLTTLGGHRGGAWGVALSGNRGLLASASCDGRVKLWNTTSAQLSADLQGHTGIVRCVALSKDGALIASGGQDATVRLWDAPSGRSLRVLRRHTGRVGGVALSADGRLLASGGTDGAVHIWDVASGTCLRTLRPDRPYERLNITGLSGLTEAQRGAMLAHGAIER